MQCAIPMCGMQLRSMLYNYTVTKTTLQSMYMNNKKNVITENSKQTHFNFHKKTSSFYIILKDYDSACRNTVEYNYIASFCTIILVQ